VCQTGTKWSEPVSGWWWRRGPIPRDGIASISSGAVQRRLILDGSGRLILDTLCWVLGRFAGAKGPFVSYLAVAGARSGLDQDIADEESQQVAVDVNITT
jgi:hypothetical protein